MQSHFTTHAAPESAHEPAAVAQFRAQTAVEARATVARLWREMMELRAARQLASGATQKERPQ